MNKKKSRIIGIFSFSFSIMIIILVLIYINYRNIVISKQQEQLVTISKTASDYIEKIFKDNMCFIDNYFDMSNVQDFDKSILDKVTKFKSVKKNVIGDAYYISESELTDENIIKDVGDSKDVIIGPTRQNDNGTFEVLILKNIYYENIKRGVLVCILDLNRIYKTTIGSIEVGKYGYCTVKDYKGLILMHSDPKQVGINSFQERKKNYPELNTKDINRLINGQLSGKPGADLVESYWWGVDEEHKVKKLIGYAPIEFDNIKWIVSSVMSYDEIAAPITKAAYLLTSLGFIIVGTCCIFIFVLKYKNQLTDALVKLRKHEESLNQLNRVETLGMFAGTVAHDIRNMLTPVQIYCDLFIDSFEEDESMLENLNNMKEAVEGCTLLTGSLLEYTKAGKMNSNKENFDGCEAIAECLNMAKSMIPSNIKVKIEIEEKPIIIFGNRLELKQIVLNLITNSYQAMELSGGELSVKFVREEDFAVLCVNDTGCGMTKELQKYIFKPFYSTKKVDKGTGLGLPIVKSLVQSFDGSIELNSEINVGTSFTVKIPINR